MSDLETIVRSIVREEVREMLCQTSFGAALLGEPPAPPKRDTIPAPPPAKKRARRKMKRAELADTQPDIEASTRTAARELRGILLGYFTTPTAPPSWTPRELCEAIGGEARDIGRHLQAMAKAGDLVLEGSRRNARYRLPVQPHANGAAP